MSKEQKVRMYNLYVKPYNKGFIIPLIAPFSSSLVPQTQRMVCLCTEQHGYEKNSCLTNKPRQHFWTKLFRTSEN